MVTLLRDEDTKMNFPKALQHPWPRTILGLWLSITAFAVPCAASADTPVPATMAAAATTISEISIGNFSFHPAVLTVKAGTKVTWTNHDNTPHTVTSSDKRFTSSGGLDTGDQYSFVFGNPGTYEYFCSLHPMMVGKVIVQPAW